MPEYQTVNYDFLLRGVCDLIGTTKDKLQTQDAQTIKRAVSDGIEAAWRYARWPELSRTQRRAFRPTYSAATTYQVGTEVLWLQEQQYYHAVRSGGFSGTDPTDANGVLNATHWAVSQAEYSASNYDNTKAYAVGDIVYYPNTDTHYQAIAAGTGNLPTDTSFWGPLVIFSKHIAFDQTGETEWEPDDFFGVFDKDPKVYLSARLLQHSLSNNGVQLFDDEVPARPYLWFRTKAPVLIGDPYSATATYAVNDQISFESASTVLNFYDCVTATSAGESPDSAAAKWQIVDIPRFMTRFLKAYAHAVFLSNDGQEDRRMAPESLSERLLAEFLLRRKAQNSSQVRTRVATRKLNYYSNYY